MYTCPTCYKHLYSVENFHSHLRTHQNEPSIHQSTTWSSFNGVPIPNLTTMFHACPHCDRQFYSWKNYRDHLKTHPNETRQIEKTDRRAGTKEMFHSCLLCNKQFYSKENLQAHVRTHARQEVGQGRKTRPRQNNTNKQLNTTVIQPNQTHPKSRPNKQVRQRKKTKTHQNNTDKQSNTRVRQQKNKKCPKSRPKNKVREGRKTRTRQNNTEKQSNTIVIHQKNQTCQKSRPNKEVRQREKTKTCQNNTEKQVNTTVIHQINQTHPKSPPNKEVLQGKKLKTHQNDMEKQVNTIVIQPKNPTIVSQKTCPNKEMTQESKIKTCQNDTEKQLNTIVIQHDNQTIVYQKTCPKKLFECPYCEETNHIFLEFQRHIRTHASQTLEVDQLFRCPHCYLCFNTSKRLSVHVEVLHRNKRQFDCRYCGKMFSEEMQLSMHLQFHAEGKRLRCVDCGVGLSSWANVRQHVCVHRREKHSCSSCSRDFGSLLKLLNHSCSRSSIRIVSSSDSTERLLQPVSPRDREADAVLHIPVSKDNNSDHTLSGFNNHIISLPHAGSSPQPETKKRVSLEAHTDKWSDCGKAEHGSPELTQCIGYTHQSDETFKCCDCGDSFHIFQNLQEHLKEHTQANIRSCPTCIKGFPDTESLQKHIVTHV